MLDAWSNLTHCIPGEDQHNECLKLETAIMDSILQSLFIHFSRATVPINVQYNILGGRRSGVWIMTDRWLICQGENI